MDIVDLARGEAFKAGLTPSEFWASTPFESREWCKRFARRQEEEYKRGSWVAWHIALYSRQKKLPELSAIMRRFDDQPAVAKPQTAAILFDKVRLLNAAFGGRETHG